MKKIIVLGGHGFVGTAVTNQLKKMNHEVFPLSRSDGLDLLDLKSTEKHFSDIQPNVIINCAAHVGSLHYVTEFAATVLSENTRINLNIYDAVKSKCPECLIINPISNCSYSGDSSIQKEDEWLNGPVHKSVLSYGNGKRMLVYISQCYEMEYSIRSSNFLVPNCYGPGDYMDPNKTHALNGMILRMLKSRASDENEFEVWGTGSPKREWIYVEDLANFLASSIDIDKNYVYPINVAQDKSYSIKETAEMIRQSIEFKGSLKFNTKYQDGDPIKQLDAEKFKDEYPNFRFTDIIEGINNTVSYYRKKMDV